MKYLILLSSLVGLVLLTLLSSLNANTDVFSNNYLTLLILTGTLAFSLLVLVAFQVWQLRGKLKQQIYGAKLTLRLVKYFALIAVLPGILVYAVSVQFLGKSIESWFDVRVERALEGGLSLARGTLQNGLDELEKKGQFVVLILAEQEPQRHQETLQRFIAEERGQSAMVFDSSGKEQARVGKKVKVDVPTLSQLREAWTAGKVSRVESLFDDSLMLRVLIPIRSTLKSADKNVLQYLQPVPKKLAAEAEMVQSVYGDYQELSLSRLGLKRLYGITLTLSLLIVLLTSISVALWLSEQLSAPLAALAAGTRAVAQGDFSSNYPVQSDDELGGLTRLFNQMTAQLGAAKKFSEIQQRQVEGANAYLENVLANLSSGVLVVDEQLKLRSVNASVSQITGLERAELIGRSLQELIVNYVLLRPLFEAMHAGVSSSQETTWQRQVERMSKEGTQVLLLKGTRLRMEAGPAHVLVFDDISHLLQAERQAAWGEVARRLAHEIKNPLTPIQLSAERLQHKLTEKLEAKDAQLLARATQTIVSQVGALKNMVTDFADYARSPSPKLVQLDMHQLINEVMGLYEANSSPITLFLQASHTRINGDATRLRQVVHNLLQNSHDALQHTTYRQIVVSTEDAAEGMLAISIADNGSGFPEQLLARAFEPYMTTKPKGTGLGLPIVKKIVEEHGGKISLANQEHGGTCVSILLPVMQAIIEEYK